MNVRTAADSGAPSPKELRVAFLSSEAVPYSKTGGLGDVSGALPKALVESGEADVALVTPLFRDTPREHYGEHPVFDNLDVEWLGGRRRTRVWFSEACGAPTFLVDAPEYFGRDSIYGFGDDHERFAFFSRAALALLGRLGDQPPDVIHLNDWQCGFASVWLRASRPWGGFLSGTRTLFSIHNLAYQGLFDPADLWRLGFRHGDETNYFLSNGAASALKAGLMATDAISTVSRRYAQEIQTAEHGHGLDWLLRQRSDRLIGVTNGVDYEVWNPEADPHLAAHYSREDLSGKAACKRDLLETFGLPVEPDRPLIATVSRLTPQKGFDLVKQAARQLLETGAYYVALGSGSREYESFLQALRDAAPHRVGVYKGFSEPLAHKIEAGADIFLMPSQYEPCGLNQMYSMRYGTVPVVRATGGLDDTVEHFDAARGTGTGFKFWQYSAAGMLGAVQEALQYYRRPDLWRRIQLNGMAQDNSWAAAARKYLAIYRRVATL